MLGPLEAPEVLLLGLPGPDGCLRVAGRIGPVPAAARDELAAVVAPPRGRHPWPERIPSSGFGQLPPTPVAYTPAEPLLVVEVDADVCWEQDRWRHATTFRRLRLDLCVEDLGDRCIGSSSWASRCSCPRPVNEHVTLAYASTVHAAHGRTVDAG